MGIINILDAQTANMIAAGEVVDRPAGALKELLENALDAGATRISVEIKGGGRAFMRITDNGKGFYRDDIPKALLRHATSKIKDGNDLTEIATFGFRGEALAAISSVSCMEIISRHREETAGTRLTSDENGVVMVDTGCPEGTTVIVKDLFYNTPARQKFLKRDATEGSACVSAVSAAAVSHPEVSFTLTVDGEKRFFTTGDGKLLQVLYAVYGKAFAATLQPVEYDLDGISVSGYVTSPDGARGSRSMQMFFVNGRPIRSKTMMAALEEAFRSYLPHGKYPGCVLFLTLPFGATDVNVHPAKLEIRFADERPVFSAVYHGVKSALQAKELPPEETSFSQPSLEEMPKAEFFPKAETEKAPAPEAPVYTPPAWEPRPAREAPARPTFGGRAFSPRIGEEDLSGETMLKFAQPSAEDLPAAEEISATETPFLQTAIEEKPYYRLVGELYNAFLVVETEKEVLFIDKHAAHERILYEKLASRKEVHSQQLLAPISITLTGEESAALLENASHLEEYGFEVEAFGSDTVLVRAVPGTLAGTRDLKGILEGFAADLAKGGRVSFAEKCDRALFTVACKAALKAGIPNAPEHNAWVVERLMEDASLRFCPHGRPVIHPLPRRDMEKFFDR